MRLEELYLSNSLTLNDSLKYDLKNDSPLPPPEIPLTEDRWGFNHFWTEVKDNFSTVEELYGAIQDLYEKIETIKERFRPQTHLFPELTIEPNEKRGVSGSYFMVDEEGKAHYIVKPLNEDAGCIHSNGYATPFYSSPLRTHIPLYESSMREVLAYEIACSIGVGGIVPKTSLAIIESEKFHQFSDQIRGDERSRYFELCPPDDREKLCSVQEFVQNGKTLFEAIHELEGAGLSDDEITQRFDQDDFEAANILLWTTYDTDGHMGNFLVYPKGVDEIGNELLGLKKIDNGLAFPEKNRQLRNNLSYLPNAKLPLSEEGLRKIGAMDVEKLAQQFEKMGLESAIPALRERIPYLQKVAQEPGITLKEINRKLIQLGKKA